MPSCIMDQNEIISVKLKLYTYSSKHPTASMTSMWLAIKPRSTEKSVSILLSHRNTNFVRCHCQSS